MLGRAAAAGLVRAAAEAALEEEEQEEEEENGRVGADMAEQRGRGRAQESGHAHHSRAQVAHAWSRVRSHTALLRRVCVCCRALAHRRHTS